MNKYCEKCALKLFEVSYTVSKKFHAIKYVTTTSYSQSSMDFTRCRIVPHRFRYLYSILNQLLYIKKIPFDLHSNLNSHKQDYNNTEMSILRNVFCINELLVQLAMSSYTMLSSGYKPFLFSSKGLGFKRKHAFIMSSIPNSKQYRKKLFEYPPKILLFYSVHSNAVFVCCQFF